MDQNWLSDAKQTRAFFVCLVCGYTGPLVYDPQGVAVCQRCQSGSPTYLVPHCPSCGLYVGMAATRAGAETRRYVCPSCGCSWQERLSLSG